jgi:EmrB/QacA subfamily drug resistance transporter
MPALGAADAGSVASEATAAAAGGAAIDAGVRTPEQERRRWLALAGLILPLLLVGFAGTFLGVALPKIQFDLEASTTALTWIQDSYLLVFTASLLLMSGLGDRIGRRRMLRLGIVVFGVSTGLCALTPDGPSGIAVLIGLRAVAGLGAAMTMPPTLSLISSIFPDPEERRKAVAIWGAGAGMGIAVGPLLAGLILEHLSWQSLFLFALPFVVLSLVATFTIIPESRLRDLPRIDIVGALLSMVLMGTLVYAIIEGPKEGIEDPFVIGALAIAAVSLIAFVLWELRQAHPLLEVRLFRIGAFSASAVALLGLFFCLTGLMFTVGLYTQAVLGFSSLKSGVIFIPLVVGIILTALPSAAIDGRIGARKTAALGFLVIIGAIVWMVLSWSTHSGEWLLMGTFLLLGAGVGLATTPSTNSMITVVKPHQISAAVAMQDLSRELGSAIGTAAIGGVFAARYTSVVKDGIEHIPKEIVDKIPPDIADRVPRLWVSPAEALRVAGEVHQLGRDDIAAGIVAGVRDAFVKAQGTSFAFAVGIAAISLVLVLLFMPKAPSTQVDIAH